LISLLKNTDHNRGFWLNPIWQGQKIISDASEAATDYGFIMLEMPMFRVPKAAPNTASRRISEQQGMRIVAVEGRDYTGGRFTAEIWEITGNEWLAGQSAPSLRVATDDNTRRTTS